MAASAYALKDDRFEELLQIHSGDRMGAKAFVNGSLFFGLILESNRKNTESSFVNMTTAAFFEVIIFSHLVAPQRKYTEHESDYASELLRGYSDRFMCAALVQGLKGAV